MNREQQALLMPDPRTDVLSESDLPLDAGDAFALGYEQSTRLGMTSSPSVNWHQATHARGEKIKTLLGEVPAWYKPYLTDQPDSFDYLQKAHDSGDAQRFKAAATSNPRVWHAWEGLRRLREQHPDLEDDATLAAGTRAELQALDRRAKDKGDQATGGASAAMFLGNVAGVMQDPINVGSLAVGIPAAASTASTVLGRALKVAGYTAATSAATETAIQPFVVAHNKELGLEYGLDEALTNIAAAGVGGGLIGGVGSASADGFRALVRQYGDAVDAGTITPTRDTEAAVQVLDDAARALEANAFEGTPQGEAAHLQALDRATQQLQAGEPVDVESFARAYRDETNSTVAPEVPNRTAPIDQDLHTGPDLEELTEYDALTGTPRGTGDNDPGAQFDYDTIGDSDVIPMETITADGEPVIELRPAREALAEVDTDLEAVDAAIVCLTGGG